MYLIRIIQEYRWDDFLEEKEAGTLPSQEYAPVKKDFDPRLYFYDAYTTTAENLYEPSTKKRRKHRAGRLRGRNWNLPWQWTQNHLLLEHYKVLKQRNAHVSFPVGMVFENTERCVSSGSPHGRVIITFSG